MPLLDLPVGPWNYGSPDPPAKPLPVFNRSGIDWYAYGRYGPYDTPSILYVLVQLARVAYSTDPDLWTAVAFACGLDAAYLVPNSANAGKPGVVGFKKYGMATIMMCRGTTTISQWLSYGNIDQASAVGVEGRVFSAFMGFAVTQNAALYGDIFNDAAQAQAGERLIVGGHSLGGALMRVISHRLNKMNVRGTIPDVCVTFGCPRVGNGDFAWYKYDLPHVRVCRKDDGVCDVPPAICLRRTLGGVGPSIPTTYQHGQGVRVLLSDDAPPERGASNAATSGQALAAMRKAITLGIADGGHALRDYSKALRPYAILLREVDYGGRIFGIDDTLNGLNL